MYQAVFWRESYKMAVRVAFLICVLATIKVTFAQQPDCTSNLVGGPCRGKIPRYGVNPDTNKCERFDYSGCGGNGNNYESMRECEANCPPDCTSALATGPCRASIPRFGYNPRTHKCEPFTYGGCGGNRNRYVSSDDCNSACA